MTVHFTSCRSWSLAGQDGDMGGPEHLIGQLGQPVEGNQVNRRRAEWYFRGATLHKKCIGDELGVALPFQAKGAEVLRKVVHARLRWRDAIALAQPDEAGVIVRCALLTAMDRQIRDPLRGAQ